MHGEAAGKLGGESKPTVGEWKLALQPELRETMEVVANPPAVRAPVDRQKLRSRATNDPRFLAKQPPTPRAVDRRRRDLVEAFMGALGGPEAVSPVVAMQVRRAAELVTAVEMARANMLNGVPTDMLALVRLEGVAARAVRVLGIKVEQPPPKKTAPAGLQIARARWAANEAQKAKQAEASQGGTPKDMTEGPPDGRAAE
jgi:hypothetical protein